MMHSHSGRCLSSLIALACTVSFARAADLETEVSKWQESHAPLLQQASELAQAGEVARGNRLLIEAADHDGSGTAAFAIANMLYRNDPATSYRLHERALKAFPHEAAAHLEMAMEQHRKKEYAAAIINYRICFKAGVGGQYTCLLADCLLRTGQLQEAVEAWRAANHSANHTGIDFAIFEISGPLQPMQRRGDLLGQIKAGDSGKFGALLVLDANFDTDWWNSSVFTEALDLDLQLAQKMLGANDARYRALATYAQLARQEEPKAAEIRQALQSAKLVIGPGATLPADSTLARALCEYAVRNEVAAAKDLLAAHGADLRARVERKDRAALHLLSWLTVETDPAQLAPLDRLGWKEWGDPEFAVSYIAGLVGSGKITRPDEPELVAALAALPEDTYLNRFRLQLAGQDHLTQPLLVAAIKAEYHQLSEGMAIRDSYTLKSFFYLLADQLGMNPETKAPGQTTSPAKPAAKKNGT